MNEKNKDGCAGTLRISRDVLSTIAKTAASEVEEVHGLAVLSGDNIKGLLVKPKPVDVTLNDELAVVELHLVLKQGVKIPAVSQKVQKAVKEAIQNMTAITVSGVNVVIEGIFYPGEAVATDAES